MKTVKQAAITEARQAISTAIVEQVTGMRDNVHEVCERILSDLYDAAAKGPTDLLIKYAPRKAPLAAQDQCPACKAWWPRHNPNCEIGDMLSARDRIKQPTKQ